MSRGLAKGAIALCAMLATSACTGPKSYIVLLDSPDSKRPSEVTVTNDKGTRTLSTTGDYVDGNPVFSPDGRSLAVVSNRENLEERHIWIVPLDGSPPKRLTKGPPGVEANLECGGRAQRRHRFGGTVGLS